MGSARNRGEGVRGGLGGHSSSPRFVPALPSTSVFPPALLTVSTGVVRQLSTSSAANSFSSSSDEVTQGMCSHPSGNLARVRVRVLLPASASMTAVRLCRSTLKLSALPSPPLQSSGKDEDARRGGESDRALRPGSVVARVSDESRASSRNVVGEAKDERERADVRSREGESGGGVRGSSVDVTVEQEEAEEEELLALFTRATRRVQLRLPGGVQRKEQARLTSPACLRPILALTSWTSALSSSSPKTLFQRKLIGRTGRWTRAAWTRRAERGWRELTSRGRLLRGSKTVDGSVCGD
jgi:hypothetical protein